VAPKTFDNPIKLNTVAGRKETLRQTPVFGGNRQTAAMAGAEVRCHIAEIGHGVDILPDVWNGDDDIRIAKPKPDCDLHPLVGARQAFTHEVLAGDTEDQRPLRPVPGQFQKPRGMPPRHRPSPQGGHDSCGHCRSPQP
jgi:hypothetical protein